jgi:hypothetical protein
MHSTKFVAFGINPYTQNFWLSRVQTIQINLLLVKKDSLCKQNYKYLTATELAGNTFLCSHIFNLENKITKEHMVFTENIIDRNDLKQSFEHLKILSLSNLINYSKSILH